MDIKELYITDLQPDGNFWSTDKIKKLNDMFSSLASGMNKGIDGPSGVGGSPGIDGVTGSIGITGATGANGISGSQGSGIWTRTTSTSGRETLSLKSNTSGIVLGATSTLIGSTCDFLTNIGTTIPVQSGHQLSALRLHAINDTGSTLRKHIKLKSKTYSATSPADTSATLEFNPTTQTTLFYTTNYIAMYASNILIYDGTSAVAAFTDSGIVIASDLTFAPSTIQIAKNNTTLPGVAALWHAANAGGTLAGSHLSIKTGLSQGNVEFKKITNSFTSFPKGSIVQVNDDTFKQYFNVQFNQVPSFTSYSSHGKEVYIGRGEGPWAGWYSMNGRAWRFPIGTPNTGAKTLKRMNSANHSILGLIDIPSTFDDKISFIGGGNYGFNIPAPGVMSMGFGSGFNSPGGDTIYPGDFGSFEENTIKSTAAYICYLGVTDWVWYTEPPIVVGPADATAGAQVNFSDRLLKKNINVIGESPSGLTIYSFEYTDVKYGKGLFQGVISDEIPKFAVINNGQYDSVDYSLIDVEFKQIQSI
jgi:hypothetical protein